MVALRSDRPVTLAELAHLETRRPDEGVSGYKNTFKATHGEGWRVRLKWGGKLRSLKGIFVSPREAAKALVRFYREHLGDEWTTRIRPGFYLKPEKAPPRVKPWYVSPSMCGDPRKGAAGWCPKLARLARPRRPRPIEGDGYRIFEQETGEWVVTARVLGHTVYVDKPGRISYFHTRESAHVFLGMWQRARWPWLGLRILGESRITAPRLPHRNIHPRKLFPLTLRRSPRPAWRRLPEIYRDTPALPFAVA